MVFTFSWIGSLLASSHEVSIEHILFIKCVRGETKGALVRTPHVDTVVMTWLGLLNGTFLNLYGPGTLLLR